MPGVASARDLALMPMPSKLERGSGALAIDGHFRIAFAAPPPARLDRAARRFLTQLARETGIPLSSGYAGTASAATLWNTRKTDPARAAAHDGGSATLGARDVPVALLITCRQTTDSPDALGDSEAYRLEVTPQRARLTSPTVIGAMRGLQTFLQLVSLEGNGFSVPAVSIDDAPRFPWRGLLIDVTSHFMPAPVIERTLDAMEAVKLNVFHWHLTDDQGFRVESKVFPKLHTLGAGGDYYTQNEIRHLINYARDRGIRIVPEFDMPGHCATWLIGYPELASAPGPYSIIHTFGIYDPALDPTREPVYAFLDKLIGEMAALFPDRYFHIGGDEVTGKHWKENAAIQAFIRQHNLKDEAGLQAYFNRRVLAIVNKHGKTMMGWDEVLHPDLPKDVVVQSWRDNTSLAAAVKSGYRGLLSYGYYLDHLESAGKYYSVDPLGGPAANLPADAAARILGGEACMWTEFISPETIDSRIWPKTAAIAERFWSPASLTAVPAMYERLEEISRRLDFRGVRHNLNVDPMLGRIAPRAPLEALRTLAAALDPLGIDGRETARRYAQDTPLNRMVDAARGDSAEVRSVNPRTPAAARATLIRWRDNHQRLAPYFASSPMLREVEGLSADLETLGKMGLQALDYLPSRNAPSGWARERFALLDGMEKPRAEVVLAAVRPIRALLAAAGGAPSAPADWARATIVIRTGALPPAERTAATVLAEELEKRTGLRLPVSTAMPAQGPAIALTSTGAGTGAEGYHLQLDQRNPTAPVLWVRGADPRGVLFGVGALLRTLDWAPGRLTLPATLDVASAPAYPIRGHQLGYRNTANSYDAWTVAEYEQYIRELAFFGVNSIENIPFHDGRPSPVMKVDRREMNRAISEICARYGLDYWVWVPADFDLKDSARRARMLSGYQELFRDSPTLTGIFFPGGDPGSNPPDLVLPFLEDVAKLMRPVHPQAKIWLSLQWFNKEQVDAIYQYIERTSPEWLGGLVAGPSSPPIAETRRRLPGRYRLRLYPDITHNKLSQYEVPWWDQAYALTLGREAINPRPAEYAIIHNWFAPWSDGFISYSDGAHDDVNKAIWSSLAWDPKRAVRDILTDYARVFFRPDLAVAAADGILALEKNWRGPLGDNGAVESTLLLWKRLEGKAPRLEANWRWQMCLLRANYDAYVRRRLLRETGLEQRANAILAEADKLGSEEAISEADAILNRAVAQPESPEIRARISELCDRLFHSIGLQTSVEKYFASGEERGAILDFVDYPLNNRWWLEDEFKKVRALPSETEKCRRLQALAAWEHPGPGSFYDSVGNFAKSPHVIRSDIDSREPGAVRESNVTFWWWDQGKSRARLSWQATMWPRRMVYEGLDPAATYVVRTSGYGQCPLRIDGARATPTLDGREMGEFKEFPVPAEALKDRELILTFDRPENEERLNWRRQSRLAEVWLLRVRK